AVTVLRYSTMQEADKGFLDKILGTPAEQATGTVYFVVRDGLVERFWSDQLEEGKLFQGKSEGGEKKKEKDSG
ncbi:MAG TPA: hypothetical protein VFF36_02120, partial [Planctomycetota bacterium]|nr:hypothetical protein [Planctomycetota bacterium]